MAKKLTVDIILLEEADKVSNSVLEKDFLKYFCDYMPKMPWFKEISKISIKS